MSIDPPAGPPNDPSSAGSSYPQSAPVYSPPPQKKSSMPWIIGGCGCALLLALAAAATVLVLYLASKNSGEKSQGGSRGGTSGGTTTFLATPGTIPADLRDKFVAFKFDYPSNFQVEPSARNFIKVSESVTEGGGEFTRENFAVGYVTMPTADADNNVVYPQLLAQLSSQFGSQFAQYREIAQMPETVAGNRGRAMTFQAAINTTPVFGKVILVRKAGSARGVCLIMLATPKDPAIKSVADVGAKGDLPGILASFELL